MTGRCAICDREETLTRHHLIPRTRHHNKRTKREFDRSIAGICRPCHSQIHALLTEKQLERSYNTVDKLRAHPDVAKFAAWIARRPRGFKATTHAQRRVSFGEDSAPARVKACEY